MDSNTVKQSLQEATDLPIGGLPGHEAPTEVLEAPPGDPMIGRKIGPYEILREIGRGGMGAVYLASRADDEFRKQVAIKLVRVDVGSDFIIRRFRNERQILAGLDHPNIARLLDGGSTPEGLPYFVMEYVEGQPIKQYCDSHRLSTRDRLKLFREVCSAVHYAHQNLIVHRDVKPGNILVKPDGMPKLLDFGIAKLLAPAAYAPAPNDVTSGLMTPDYASPEQICGDPITTASDVYSLGVLLYELLTGHRPYRTARQSPLEIIQAVCEQQPEKPSTAISRVLTAGDGNDRMTLTPEGIGRARNTQPGKLRRQLKGDLDNIVLKAMRKEPQRRYASAEQFSEDIRRYLEELPVIAAKDTVSYRTVKFVRRHKWSVAAAIVVAMILIGAATVTGWQAQLAKRERARAEQRFNDVRKLANSFMFEVHDAIENLAGSTEARQLVVKRAAEYLDSLARESADDPSLQRELAEAYNRLGEIQGSPGGANLGDRAGAIASYKKAIVIRESLAGSDTSIMDDRVWLARSYSRLSAVLGQGDAESMGYARKALEIREALLAENPAHTKIRSELAISYHDMGLALSYAGDLGGALENYRQMRDIYQSSVEAEPSNSVARRNLALAFKRIGAVLLKTSDLSGAAESYRRALEIEEASVEAEPNNAVARLNLSYTLSDIGMILRQNKDYAGALKHYRRALAIREDISAADPKEVRARSALGTTYQRLGAILEETGEFAGALEYYRRGLQIKEALFAANTSDLDHRIAVADSYCYIGNLHAAIGSSAKSRAERGMHWREARSAYQRALEFWKDLSKAGRPDATDACQPDQLGTQIAKCDAELARLR